MDPDEVLKKAREAAKRAQEAIEEDPDVHGNGVRRDDATGDLVETFEALDRWLSKGGFLPKDWTRTNEVTRG